MSVVFDHAAVRGRLHPIHRRQARPGPEKNLFKRVETAKICGKHE